MIGMILKFIETCRSRVQKRASVESDSNKAESSTVETYQTVAFLCAESKGAGQNHHSSEQKIELPQYQDAKEIWGALFPKIPFPENLWTIFVPHSTSLNNSWDHNLGGQLSWGCLCTKAGLKLAQELRLKKFKTAQEFFYRAGELRGDIGKILGHKEGYGKPRNEFLTANLDLMNTIVCSNGRYKDQYQILKNRLQTLKENAKEDKNIHLHSETGVCVDDVLRPYHQDAIAITHNGISTVLTLVRNARYEAGYHYEPVRKTEYQDYIVITHLPHHRQNQFFIELEPLFQAIINSEEKREAQFYENLLARFDYRTCHAVPLELGSSGGVEIARFALLVNAGFIPRPLKPGNIHWDMRAFFTLTEEEFAKNYYFLFGILSKALHQTTPDIKADPFKISDSKLTKIKDLEWMKKAPRMFENAILCPLSSRNNLPIFQGRGNVRTLPFPLFKYNPQFPEERLPNPWRTTDERIAIHRFGRQGYQDYLQRFKKVHMDALLQCGLEEKKVKMLNEPGCFEAMWQQVFHNHLDKTSNVDEIERFKKFIESHRLDEIETIRIKYLEKQMFLNNIDNLSQKDYQTFCNAFDTIYLNEKNNKIGFYEDDFLKILSEYTKSDLSWRMILCKTEFSCLPKQYPDYQKFKDYYDRPLLAKIEMYQILLTFPERKEIKPASVISSSAHEEKSEITAALRFG